MKQTKSITLRAQKIDEDCKDSRLNVSKMGALMGSDQSHFRSTTGQKAGTAIMQRFRAFFPNVNPSWMFGGKEPMLLNGTYPEVPSLLLSLNTPLLLEMQEVVWKRPDYQRAREFFTDNGIDPNEVARRYGNVMPILIESSSTLLLDNSDPYPTTSTSDTPTFKTYDQLAQENKFLRQELQSALYKIESIEKILSGRAKIAPITPENPTT